MVLFLFFFLVGFLLTALRTHIPTGIGLVGGWTTPVGQYVELSNPIPGFYKGHLRTLILY
jgi:hypothetical protein